ncbi:MAG: hypothetical protein P8R36_01935 [Actinomycetota bacterium]|nr:hypothetical protein [Actinomycetota bacterium]
MKLFSMRWVAVALVVTGVAFMVSPSSATTNVTNPVFNEQIAPHFLLNTVSDMNATGTNGAHINAGLNESSTQRDSDLAPLGAFLVENDTNACWNSEGPNKCDIAYCGEYGVAAAAPNETSLTCWFGCPQQ